MAYTGCNIDRPAAASLYWQRSYNYFGNFVSSRLTMFWGGVLLSRKGRVIKCLASTPFAFSSACSSWLHSFPLNSSIPDCTKMAGCIRKREILVHANLVIRLYGFRVFARCILARKNDTFLKIVMG